MKGQLSEAGSAGDGELRLRCGRVAAVDGPLSRTADTTHYRYNRARETVGVISPDPDGAGSLERRAVSNLSIARPTQVTDELGRTTLFTYDGSRWTTASTPTIARPIRA